MNKHEYIEKLYQCVDNKNVKGLSAFLEEEVCFQFGNATAVTGKNAVLAANDRFFTTIQNISHRIDNVWAQDDDLICNGKVSYTRLNGSKFSATFATILKVKNSLIADYLIYADVSEL